MVIGVFIFIFIVGFIISAFFNSDVVVGAVLYGVSIIGTMLYVIIYKLDKILSMKEKD